MPEKWYHDTAEAVLRKVGSIPTGLAVDEAQTRLTKNGPNALRETKGISPWSIFLRQLQSPLVWILIAAGFVSGFVGDMVDTVAALKCMESALTGESEPTTKTMTVPQENELPIGDRNNLVFMGTQVAAGAGRAVVVATGMHGARSSHLPVWKINPIVT